MAVNKKIPMRKCVGCGEMKPKKELIRVVKSPEGEVSLDFKEVLTFVRVKHALTCQ